VKILGGPARIRTGDPQVSLARFYERAALSVFKRMIDRPSFRPDKGVRTRIEECQGSVGRFFSELCVAANLFLDDLEAASPKVRLVKVDVESCSELERSRLTGAG
jgi:hypothetical protein